MKHRDLAETFLRARDAKVVDLENAVEHGVRAYALGGGNVASAALVVGSAHHGLEDWSDAAAWLRRAGAEAELEQVRARKPRTRDTSTDAVAEAIDAAFSQGAEGARRALEALLARADLSVAQRVDVMRARANVENQCQEWDEAVQWRRRAVDLNPSDANLHVELGLECFNANPDDAAIAAYEAARAVGPTRGLAEDGIGCVHFVNERFAEAEASFRAAGAWRIVDPELRFNLARSVMKQARPDEARALVAEAAELGHDTAMQWCEKFDITVPKLWVGHANDLFAAGDAEAAAQHYDRGIEILRTQTAARGDFFSRRLALALSNRGFALFQLGDMASAEIALREAIEHRPGLRDAHNHLGNVLEQTDRLDAAVEAFRACGALDPAYAGAPYGEAGALERLGRIAEASVAIDRALRIGYGDASRQADLERRAQCIAGRA